VHPTQVSPEDTGNAGMRPERRGRLEYRRLGRRQRRPGRPPAGSIPMRKIPGGLGDRVPQRNTPKLNHQPRRRSSLVLTPKRRFPLNQNTLEGPFAGVPVILEMKVVGAQDRWLRVRIDTNAGHRELFCTGVQVRQYGSDVVFSSWGPFRLS
jgi:hypothetical protein